MILSKKTRVAIKRVMWVFIPAVLVLGLGVVGLSFYTIHRITHPARTPLYGSPRDFEIILQKPMWSDEKWKNSDGTESVGWFLSRGRQAPAIIVTHGYGSNRSDVLTLSFELWKSGYNVLLYDMRGHGESPVKWSGLGTYEKDDLLSAIRFLKNMRTDSHEEVIDGRIGLYGVDVGGYVSLVASSQDPAVKAVAVDSVYPNVGRFINAQLKGMVGKESDWANRLVDSPWTNRMTDLAMQVYLMRREDSSPAEEAVAAVSGRKFFFITAKDTGLYDAMTRDLYKKTKDTKELAEVEQTRLERLYVKASSDYDQRVAAFFKAAIPVASEKADKVGMLASASRRRRS
ncbi:MAG TPA: alpha/beta hydrolase [Blastocatellia bacterium]|nr:alpha/beta hydrolase [Blastocatellia bacterium]